MAQQIPCDICQRTTADFIITAINNGDTLGVGIECVGAWAEQLVSAYDAAQAAQTPPGGPLDGMPAPTPVPAASGPVATAEAAQAGADVSDAEWEASGAAGRPPGRPEAPETGPADQLAAETEAVAADVDG